MESLNMCPGLLHSTAYITDIDRLTCIFFLNILFALSHSQHGILSYRKYMKCLYEKSQLSVQLLSIIMANR